MLFPGKIVIIAVALPAALSLVLLIDQRPAPALLFLDAVVVAVAAIDGFLAWRSPRRLSVELTVPGTWSLGRRMRITMTLAWRGRRRLHIRALPDVPRSVVVADGAHQAVIAARSRIEVTFEATADERGTWMLRGVHVELRSPLGLWRQHTLVQATSEDGVVLERHIHVYPNLKQLDEYALLARTDRLSLIGVRRSRRTGGDTEFERLRDYHSDDALGRMDWRATARRGVLTVRDYQTSQSQRILLVIDAGRMLTSSAAGADGVPRTLLDHSIDAALMLAWVAARQGDRIGLLAYANGVKRWVPPRGGQRQVTDLIHAVHDLHAEPVESRHEDAFLHLERRERKRSLVVLFTHVLDEVNAAHLERHARLIAGRHLPLIILLRDPDLHHAVPTPDAPPTTADALWRAGAAATLVNWRAQVIDQLRASGALVIDCEPAGLTAEVVSRYLEIKARHWL